jgi:hypothetical protein
MRTSLKEAALAVIALVLSASATGCVADNNARPNGHKPAKAATVYYHNQVGKSVNDIETYDRWRQLFGS